MKRRMYGKSGFCIVTNIEKPPEETVQRLAEFPSSIIGDGMGRLGIMDSGIRPLNPDLKLCGPALTVETRAADNLMIHAALRIAEPGDVLVVNTHGDLSAGIWGELTTRMAIRKRLGGLVIDGSIRDSRELAKSGFPIYYRGICPCGGGKDGPGQVNLPISCGGVTVNPGDILVGDGDGVVVVPCSKTEAAIGWAQSRVEAEKKRFEAIAGEDEDAIYPAWLIPTLRAKGVLGEDELL